jgi:2-amino-4-hydroxy-6-hydroxymethyldihydropteridine diphosphokinase
LNERPLTEIPDWAVVIGLGGNVGSDGEIRARFVRARAAFREYGHVNHARLYRTAPIGPPQRAFLNTALQVRIDAPDGTPDELIAIVLDIERSLGRDRRTEERWGPRTIDLDVLVWGTRIVKTPNIELPHPRVRERRFALQPLCDLLGPFTFPGTPYRIVQLLERVENQSLELVTDDW